MTLSVLVTKSKSQYLYSQIIAVCAHIHTKPTNTVCRHHVACLYAECHGGTRSSHWAKQLKQLFPIMTSVNTPCWRRKPTVPNITAHSNMATTNDQCLPQNICRDTETWQNSSSLHCTVSPLTSATKDCIKLTEI